MLQLVDSSSSSSSSSRLSAALRSGDAAYADYLVSEALGAGETAVAVLDRVAAALRAAAGSPETERRARLVCEHLLAITLPSLLHAAPASAERVVVAGVPGASHALGLRLVACAAESAGYDARYLGSEVPPFALARLIAHQRPVAVVLGASNRSGLPALHQAVAAVHLSAPDARVLAYGDAATGRTRILGANVAEDLSDLARLLPRHVAHAA
jgi:methanogenic corrinoid protein MtbC1